MRVEIRFLQLYTWRGSFMAASQEWWARLMSPPPPPDEPDHGALFLEWRCLPSHLPPCLSIPASQWLLRGEGRTKANYRSQQLSQPARALGCCLLLADSFGWLIYRRVSAALAGGRWSCPPHFFPPPSQVMDGFWGSMMALSCSRRPLWRNGRTGKNGKGLGH